MSGSGRGPAYVALAMVAVLVAATALVAGVWRPMPRGADEAAVTIPASAVLPSTRSSGATTGPCAWVPGGDLTKHSGTPAPVGEPSIGVLGSRAVDLGSLTARGVTSVVLEVVWSRLEPTRGCYDAAYLSEVLQRAAEIQAAGLRPVLDAGLQYPPAWVMALPGARFKNQYGDQWRGPVGSDVPDAVFNVRVRTAQATYVRAVGYLLRRVPLEAVRVGGLGNGELHYPISRYGAHDNSFWAFSSSALRVSPVKQFRPGSGSSATAQRFLSWYLGELNGYGVWLAQRFRSAFGRGPTLQMLLPSWGVRPGDRSAAVAESLSGQSRGELTGALNEGLDWASLAGPLARFPGRVDLYSTWVDAPDQGDDPVYESPVRYLAGLGAEHGLPVAGENTGNSDAADMQRSFDRLESLGLSSLFWMNAEQLVSGQYATLDELGALTATVD